MALKQGVLSRLSLEVVFGLAKLDACLFCDEGDGFLRWMIRKLVGTIIAVGQGRFALEEAVELLASGRGYGAPRAVDACGLTLMAIRRKSD